MTRAAHSRPLSEAEGDLLFSADHATTSPAAAQRRAETMIPIREVEDTFDIPDVQITGTVYKMNVQTDRKGAVLVAYTRDPPRHGSAPARSIGGRSHRDSPRNTARGRRIESGPGAPHQTDHQHDGGLHVTTTIEPRAEAAPGRLPGPEPAAHEAPAAGADSRTTEVGTDASPEVSPAPRRRLTVIMWGIAGIATLAGLVVAAVGFALSYDALVQAARGWGFGPWGSYAFPIGVDGLIVALYSIALVLAWRRMPKPMLLVAAHATTAVTIGLNVLAAANSAPGSPGVWAVAQTDLGRLIAHAAMPAAYVLLTEAARHLITRTARLESGERGLTLADWLLRFPTTWWGFRTAKTYPMSYAEARKMRRDLAIHRVWIQYREEIEAARREAEEQGEKFIEHDTVTVLDRLPDLLAPYGVGVDEALALPDRMRREEQQRRADRERAEQELRHKEEADRRAREHAEKLARLAAKAEELRAQGEVDVLSVQVEGERKAAEHRARAAADTAGIEADAAARAAERAATEAERRAAEEEQAEESAKAAALKRKTAEDLKAAQLIEAQNIRRQQELADAAKRAADTQAEAERAARQAGEDKAAALEADRRAAELRAAIARAELVAVAAEDAARLNDRERNIRRVARLAYIEAGGDAMRLPTTRIEQYMGVANSTATGYREEAAKLIAGGYDFRVDPIHAADQAAAPTNP
ncbi:DUF2637 domain-containing protein [Streptomyces sp. FBKL.4005]|uniref:DUF2637 domain-containing protein n=1 Tax=Streptomyces sp. FBKL.4005 TaxID=2015515 RepID=UPI00117D3021|nr:DUF2637 domain-containing protein [Streptomyces sp. FBKL.4005]